MRFSIQANLFGRNDLTTAIKYFHQVVLDRLKSGTNALSIEHDPTKRALHEGRCAEPLWHWKPWKDSPRVKTCCSCSWPTQVLGLPSNAMKCSPAALYRIYNKDSGRYLTVITMSNKSRTAHGAQSFTEVLNTMPCTTQLGPALEDGQRLEQQRQQLMAAYAPYRRPLVTLPSDFG